MRSLNEKILGKKEDGGGLSEIDRQELAWLRHERDPALFKKAEEIIEKLEGAQFWLKEFSKKHNIYTSYLYIAIKKLGYRETRRRGTPSVGLDYFYEKK
ncbi:hypothetical protein ES705_13243 [subsurface metagenome]